MIAENMFCKNHDTLLTAMETINSNAKGIVFIIDENFKLCGIATDGDIRRAFLKGINLQDEISLVMNLTFIYADKEESERELLSKVNHRIKVIPIVDENMKIVDYFEFTSKVRIPVAEPNLNGNEFSYAIDAILSTWISSNGKYISEFESKFADYCGCQYGVATSNGTTALHLALLALDIGVGDEVIVPDLTFAATINTVLHANATPVIVGVEQDSWCIDPAEIEKAVTPKTKAIIPVHLYGQPCDMERIVQIAKKYNLYIIEDCAEAHGAEFADQKIGSFSDISCFSFFANKVITCGEGGMCLTSSKELEEKMRTLRDHGMSKTKKYWHDVVGYNYRMTNIQAAIGLAQLERIEELLVKRNAIEALYKSIFSELDKVEFQKNNLDNRKKVTWLVTALLPRKLRNRILKVMGNHGVEVRPVFYPLSQMPIYKKYVFSSVNSQAISERGLNFPTTISIREETIKKIKDIVENELCKDIHS